MGNCAVRINEYTAMYAFDLLELEHVLAE